MQDMEPPRRASACADRQIDCEFALKTVFQKLVHIAVATGWSETEVSEALLSLARNQMAGMRADDATEADIEAAQGSTGMEP